MSAIETDLKIFEQFRYVVLGGLVMMIMMMMMEVMELMLNKVFLKYFKGRSISAHASVEVQRPR